MNKKFPATAAASNVQVQPARKENTKNAEANRKVTTTAGAKRHREGERVRSGARSDLYEFDDLYRGVAAERIVCPTVRLSDFENFSRAMGIRLYQDQA